MSDTRRYPQRLRTRAHKGFWVRELKPTSIGTLHGPVRTYFGPDELRAILAAEVERRRRAKTVELLDAGIPRERAEIRAMEFCYADPRSLR